METPKYYNTENETLSSFAKFVKEKRMAMGMSGADLAEKVFHDRKKRTFINDIETGRRKGLTLETVDKILHGLDSGIVFTEN